MEVTAHNRMYVFDCVPAVRVSALSGIKKSMINNITSKRSKHARQNDRPFLLVDHVDINIVEIMVNW